jgi:hypothetical protein
MRHDIAVLAGWRLGCGASDFTALPYSPYALTG